MNLGELIAQAEDYAPEDYCDFAIFISASSDDVHEHTTDNVTVDFSVEKGRLIIISQD